MSGAALAASGTIIDRAAHGERFLKATLFGPETGLLICLSRLSSKKPGSQPDLYDEVALQLETKGEQGPAFVKEATILSRRSGIGQRYQALSAAASLSRLLIKNGGHLDHLDAVHQLIVTALDRLSEGASPEVVLIKTYFSLTRSEGYAVREQWINTLPGDMRQTAVSLIKEPLKEAETPECLSADLRRSLEQWMITETDFLL